MRPVVSAMTGRQSRWPGGTPSSQHRSSSSREFRRVAEWAAHLSLVIWIETPREERLRRGVKRDGIAALDDWETWMAEDDVHYEHDPTRERADVVVDGTQPVERARAQRGGS